MDVPIFFRLMFLIELTHRVGKEIAEGADNERRGIKLKSIDAHNATSQLLEQTAQGNQQAFEELCRIYRGPLFRHALKILGNAETAEEVVQDVLFGVWRGAKDFKGDSKPSSWMWAILHNKAMGALRITLRAPDVAKNYDDVSLRDPEMDA